MRSRGALRLACAIVGGYWLVWKFRLLDKEYWRMVWAMTLYSNTWKVGPEEFEHWFRP